MKRRIEAAHRRRRLLFLAVVLPLLLCLAVALACAWATNFFQFLPHQKAVSGWDRWRDVATLGFLALMPALLVLTLSYLDVDRSLARAGLGVLLVGAAVLWFMVVSFARAAP